MPVPSQPPVQVEQHTSPELETLEAGAQATSLREVLAKPVTIVAIVLAICVVGVVVILQEAPGILTLELPQARYELLRNEGLTDGVPIAIQLGPLTVFEISDPMAGGAGAGRARTVVASLSEAVRELADTPGRVITIDMESAEGMPRIVQKETANAEASLEIVAVTADDMVLVKTEDAKLLARVWAERLTDSLRLLVFGQPPEFSRDTHFGAALDTLHGTALREGGALTSDSLMTAFEQLAPEMREALTTFPPLPKPVEPQSTALLPASRSSSGQGLI